MKEIDFPYSKNHAFFGVFLFALLFIPSIPRWFYFYNLRQTINYSLIGIFDLLILLMSYYFFEIYFIPAVKNKIALQINAKGIFSKVGNIYIEWSQINNIRLSNGKTSSSIIINLVNKDIISSTIHNPFRKIQMSLKNFIYGTPIVISMFGIKGNDIEIFESVKNMFEEHKT